MRFVVLTTVAIGMLTAMAIGQGMPGPVNCEVVEGHSAWSTSINMNARIYGGMVSFHWVQDISCPKGQSGTDCVACERVTLCRVTDQGLMILWNPPWSRLKFTKCGTPAATADYSLDPPVGLTPGNYVFVADFLSGGDGPPNGIVLSVTHHAFTIPVPPVYQ